MIDERWDIILRFLDGPLSYQGDRTCLGPVVQMGANPPPGGLVLDGYRGLDSIQATITTYDGETVSITPVGTSQVRVAPHPHVDWNEIQTLRNPVYLSPGDTFHLGPPHRGATITYVKSQRLGRWKQQRIIANSEIEGTIGIDEVQAHNIPRWFVPAVLSLMMLTMVGILVPVATKLGPQLINGVNIGERTDSIVYHRFVTEEDLANIEQSELDGFLQAFDAFVMAPNATASGMSELRDVRSWDDPFYRRVVAAIKYHRNAAFWRRLESIKDDYAYVTQELRAAGLPTVFAAIPYQESGYTAHKTSPVCAEGYWQFMPETANRYDLAVRDCKINGVAWSPTDIVPPAGIFRNADYVYYSEADNVARCRLQDCQVDDRTDLAASTRAAILMLKDSWEHERTVSSGAAVQMTIMAHNMGFNDTQYMRSGRTKYGVLDAYNRHTQNTGRDPAPDFYGANITCNPEDQDPHKPNTTSSRCGGLVPNQTQHYAYSIVAQHLLAVCYYATNYRSEPAFEGWEQYLYGDGYCTQITVPDRTLLRED